MSARGLAIGGAAIAAIVLAQKQGIIRGQFAGKGVVAAMNSLRNEGPIAGVSFAVAADNSPINTYKNMRDALVKAYGSTSSAAGPVPTSITSWQLLSVGNAWMRAAAAAAAADPVNFSLVKNDGSLATDAELVALGAATVFGGVDAVDIFDTSPLMSDFQKAMTDLDDYMDHVTLIVTPDKIVGVFQRVLALAAAMEDADFKTAGTRASDDDSWSWSRVPGALKAAGEASAKAGAGIAGDAAGAVAGEVLGSGLFWAAALGFVAWKVVLR